MNMHVSAPRRIWFWQQSAYLSAGFTVRRRSRQIFGFRLAVWDFVRLLAWMNPEDFSDG